MTDRKGGTHGYIRGHLRLRVHEAELDDFVWSVWVELSKDEFNLNSDHWEDPERAQLLPSPGHLATVLPYEQETLGLRVRLFNREPGRSRWSSSTGIKTIPWWQSNGRA